MHKKSDSKQYLILVTGILVGFPALITDSYLPAFPVLTKYFVTSVSSIQMSLMATMIGIAAGQLIIGPFSDKYGRIKPLLFSLYIFIASTAGCIFSGDITVFIISRLFQGLACSGGMVLSRAILTDHFFGADLSKSLSVNAAILGFTPAISPVIGGILLTFAEWQGIFVFLALFGIIVLVLSSRLPESLYSKNRKTGDVYSIIKDFALVLKNRSFISYVFILTFSMAVMFAYISSSPFIFQEHYNISPLLYSIVFGTNAAALTIGAIAAGKFRKQEDAVKTGVYGVLFMSVATVIFLISGAPFICFELSVFIMFVFNGIVYPSSTTLAMESNRENAGTASSILGAMSFFTGGIISPLVGLGNIIYSTSVGLILCSIISAGFYILNHRFNYGKNSTEAVKEAGFNAQG